MKNMKAIVHFRNGGEFHTVVDVDMHTPKSIAQRMYSGGFLVCTDSRWEDGERFLVVNLSDVSCVQIEGHVDGEQGTP